MDTFVRDFNALPYYLSIQLSCGAHSVQDRHVGQCHGGEEKDTQTQIGPVCGISVGENEGYTREPDSIGRRFLSMQCLDSFQDGPSDYATRLLEAKS